MNQNEQTHQSHFLEDEIKWAIVFLSRQGVKNKEIARQVGQEYNRPTLSHQTVKSILLKYQKTKGVANSWNPTGRPRVLDDEMEEELLEYCANNRMQSAEEYKEALNLPCSRQTVNKVLIDNGYRAYRAPTKLYLTADNIKKRFEFASSHRRWTEEDWLQYVFSDESYFHLTNQNGRIWIRRLPEEAHEEDTVQFHDAFADSILVWGAISSEGIGPLVRVQGTLKYTQYLHILRYRLKKYFPGLFDGELVWQEDGAKPHKANVIKQWFEDRDVDVAEFPPKSPDLNIIENLWDDIKFQLRGDIFESKDELWERVFALWKSITRDKIINYYESLPSRVHAVYRAKGNFTKY